jgi:hypothetical protein
MVKLTIVPVIPTRLVGGHEDRPDARFGRHP